MFTVIQTRDSKGILDVNLHLSSEVSIIKRKLKEANKEVLWSWTGNDFVKACQYRDDARKD